MIYKLLDRLNSLKSFLFQRYPTAEAWLTEWAWLTVWLTTTLVKILPKICAVKNDECLYSWPP